MQYKEKNMDIYLASASKLAEDFWAGQQSNQRMSPHRCFYGMLCFPCCQVSL
jgi:hypothetical protein